MSYLLDTHTFLWAASAPEKLPAKVRKIIEDASNDVFVSKLSFWEIALKFGLGKLDLKGSVPEQLPEAAVKMGFGILDIDADHVSSCHRLPRENHKDPFDRMLVWQAIQQKLVLVSKDKSLKDYERHGLSLVWG